LRAHKFDSGVSSLNQPPLRRLAFATRRQGTLALVAMRKSVRGRARFCTENDKGGPWKPQFEAYVLEKGGEGK